jgi:hypothetical protein
MNLYPPSLVSGSNFADQFTCLNEGRESTEIRKQFIQGMRQMLCVPEKEWNELFLFAWRPVVAFLLELNNTDPPITFNKDIFDF